MDWFTSVLDKVETPALVMSLMFIGVMYKLLIMSFASRDKAVAELSQEIQRMGQLISGQNAIINLCCVHGRKEGGR